MVEIQEEMKGTCPQCGYAYESEDDLVECKYQGNIWHLCPKCDKQI